MIVHRKLASVAILALDLAGLVGILQIAQFLRIGRWMPDPLWPVVVVVLTTLVLLYVLDTYRVSGGSAITTTGVRAAAGVLAAGALLGALAYLAGTQALGTVPIFWRGVLPVSLLGFACWAVAIRLLAQHVVRKREVQQRLLVAGAGEAIDRLVEDLRRDGMPVQLSRTVGVPAVGNGDTEEAAPSPEAAVPEFDAAVVADDLAMDPQQVRRLVDLRMSGVRVYGVSEFYEQVWSRVPLESMGDSWLLDSGGFQLVADRVAANLKRGIDVTLATVALALTAPVILLAMLVVWLESGSPTLFRQTRTGYRGRPYRLIKIRTMVREAERDGPRWAAPGDPRITKVGRFLRRSRIDELPQLWTVLRGEMSFVGPRPERPEFVARLREAIPYYDIRHFVKPGITGWAQVMHQYGDSVEDARIKLEFDLYYIKHYSVLFDAAILLKTARVVLFGRGR